MGRKSAETVHTVKTPKHILEIGMTADEYFDLKVDIKSLIARPGMPGFEGKRFNSKENEKVYRQWLHNALLELGPKFFPGGGKGLVWPEDYDKIYKAVNQVIRTLSYKTRKEHGRKMEGVRAVEQTVNDKMEVEMAGDDEHYGDGPAGSTDAGEDAAMAAKEVLQRQKQEKEVTVVEQHDQEEATEEMRTAIELEELLDLMKPEAFAQLPDLTDEDFNWEEAPDLSSQL